MTLQTKWRIAGGIAIAGSVVLAYGGRHWDFPRQSLTHFVVYWLLFFAFFVTALLLAIGTSATSAPSTASTNANCFNRRWAKRISGNACVTPNAGPVNTARTGDRARRAGTSADCGSSRPKRDCTHPSADCYHLPVLLLETGDRPAARPRRHCNQGVCVP